MRTLTQYEKRFAAIVIIIAGILTLTVVAGGTWLLHFIIGVGACAMFAASVWALSTILRWMLPWWLK